MLKHVIVVHVYIRDFHTGQFQGASIFFDFVVHFSTAVRVDHGKLDQVLGLWCFLRFVVGDDAVRFWGVRGAVVTTLGVGVCT